MSASSSRTARRATWLVAGLILAGVANNALALRWGFAWDDYLHQLILRTRPATAALRPWNLYDFKVPLQPGEPLYDSGLMPWWTSPDFKARFFRPVTSSSLWLDYALFGDWAPGYHATSLVLFAVALLLYWRLVRGLGAGGLAAVAALAFVALDDINVLPVQWLANRNTLLATLFLLAALLCVQKHLATRRPGWLAGVVLFTLLALGSKESAVAIWPLTALYLLLFGGAGRPSLAFGVPTSSSVAPAPQPVGPASGGSLVSGALRTLLCAPAFWLTGVLALGFVGAYVATGFGAHSLSYPTPWGNPLTYLFRIAGALPLALLSLLWGVSTDLAPFLPNSMPRLQIGTVLLLPPLAWIVMRATGRSRLVLFGAGWFLFSLMAESGSELSDRLWLNASLGTALIIGVLIESVWQAWRAGRRSRLAGALVSALLLAGPVAGVIGTQIKSLAVSSLARADTWRALDAYERFVTPQTRTVVLLNSPATMQALALGVIWQVERGSEAPHAFPLQYGRRGVTLQRTAPDTLHATFTSPPPGRFSYERVFVAHQELPPADMTFMTAAFTATWRVVSQTGPNEVDFRFRQALDDPAVVLLAWNGDRFERATPPAVGETLTLPPVVPPTRFTP